ncbi:MAG: hypothetical protein AAF467_12660 [Actinomycetota bacterium]
MGMGTDGRPLLVRRPIIAACLALVLVAAGCSSGEDPMDAFLAAAESAEDEPDTAESDENEPAPVRPAAAGVGTRVGLFEMPVEMEATLDPSQPRGPWGWLQLDRVVATDAWQTLTPARGQQFLVVDLHYVAASGAPGAESVTTPDSFRIVVDDRTYQPVEPPKVELVAGAVFNQPLVFGIPNSAVEVAFEAGVDESSVDGFGLSIPIVLEPGSISIDEPDAEIDGPLVAKPDATTSIATPTRCGPCRNFFIEIDSVSAAPSIGPDVADPGLVFLSMVLTATDTSESLTFTQNNEILGTDVRVGAGDEWFGPVSIDVSREITEGRSTIELVFEISGSLPATIEVGPPHPHLEPGLETTYFTVRAPEADSDDALIEASDDDQEPVPDLDGFDLDLDACNLLTDVQLITFAGKGPVRSKNAVDAFFGIEGCTWEVGPVRTITAAAFSATAYPEILTAVTEREEGGANELLGPLASDASGTPVDVVGLIEEFDDGKGVNAEAACSLFSAARAGDFDTGPGYRAHGVGQLTYWGHACRSGVMVVVGLTDSSTPDTRPDRADFLRAAIDDVFATVDGDTG